jgi:hypothetical protein
MTDRSSEPTLVLQPSDIRIVVHGSPFRCIETAHLPSRDLEIIGGSASIGLPRIVVSVLATLLLGILLRGSVVVSW